MLYIIGKNVIIVGFQSLIRFLSMSIRTEIFSKKFRPDDFVLDFISLFQVDYKSGEPKLLGRKMNFLSFIKKIRGAQGVSYYTSDILIILYSRKTTFNTNIANN